MSTPLPDGGATVVPEHAQDSKEVCVHEANNPLSRRGSHCYRWVWDGPIMTNRIRCSTCGFERINERT